MVADGSYGFSCPSSHFAELYKKHGLEGGHVIKLGPGNDRAAKDALAAWPGANSLSKYCGTSSMCLC